MDLFEMREFDGHEQVVFGTDDATGLRAIIALHSTVLGPAAGGCRMWPYATTRLAAADVLRLSRGMSYKNAMADLPFGGGKAVIIGDAQKTKTPELFEAFGRFVNSLGGRYISAEDVGTTTADMERAARYTRYVSGLNRTPGAAGGDPSPKTALGIFLGIGAAARHALGRDSLDGLEVSVQGVGGVGYYLCRLLAAAGARLRVADVRLPQIDRAVREFGASPVAVEEVLFEPVDIVAPCALGAVLDPDTIPRIRARIIAGGANNQLASDSDGWILHRAGILYAPDYVINAGGIISATREYLGEASEAQVDKEIEGIPQRLTRIFEMSRREDRPTNLIADELARERIARGRRRLVA